jgi:hypothetical protein
MDPRRAIPARPDLSTDWGHQQMRGTTLFASAISTALVFASGQSCLAAKFAWTQSEGETTLLYEGRPALRLIHPKFDGSSPESIQATMKPFHHVFSPDGETLLTKGPGGLYPHHRGLFYGFNKVTYGDGKRCDIWHSTEGAHQQYAGELASEADDDSGSHQVKIEWYGRDGDLFAVEQRKLAMRRPTIDGVTGWLIDFESQLKTTGGKIHLDGDPQHAGFHFRAAQEDIANTKEADQNREKQIYYLRTDGKGKIGEARNWDQNNPDTDISKESINRPWNAMSFELGGKRYTVLYLDHPSNPKPSRYSERAYGRFGSYFVADVTEDLPLNVKYRVWIQPGEMTVEQCEMLSAEFNAENTVLPTTVGEAAIEQ